MTADQLHTVEMLAATAEWGFPPETAEAIRAVVRDAKRYSALCRAAEWKPPFYRIDVEADGTFDAAVDSLIEQKGGK